MNNAQTPQAREKLRKASLGNQNWKYRKDRPQYEVVNVETDKCEYCGYKINIAKIFHLNRNKIKPGFHFSYIDSEYEIFEKPEGSVFPSHLIQEKSMKRSKIDVDTIRFLKLIN